MGRERINLLGKMRNLQHELEVMKEHLDEEYDAKQEIERQLSKAFADIQLWKTRYETEGVARAEEIERDKAKVAVRLAEAEDLQNEITASQTECRNFSSEYFRIKSANEEILEHLDTVKRENKNLAEEIKDLLDQLGEGGRSMHELDKSR